jgi:G3E family GTPase
MIPLALVTGFLGSGKTTCLKQLVRRHHGRKLVWLVNEFSARDVDAAVLGGETAAVVSIAGGSIFCRCLVTEFIASLRDLPARFGTPEAPVEGVVVEASGMANPAAAGPMLREARLDSVYQLATITAIVDPGTFLKLRHTLPNIRAQIEAAHHALLNKTDLYPAPLLAQTEAALREINPALAITRTRYCAAAVDIFAGAPPGAAHGALAPCRDPHFESFAVAVPPDLDWPQLRAAVATACDDIFRIKGFARQDGRCVHVDYSSSGWSAGAAASDVPSELVFIVRSPASDAVRRLLNFATKSA